MSVGWSGGPGETGIGDKNILADSLFSEKGVSKYYDDTVLETATPDVRRDLIQIHAETVDAAYRIWQEMNRHGWYNVKMVQEQKLQNVQNTAQRGMAQSPWGVGGTASGTAGGYGGGVTGGYGASGGRGVSGGYQASGYGTGSRPMTVGNISRNAPGGLGGNIGYSRPVGSRLMGGPPSRTGDPTGSGGMGSARL